MLLAVLCLAASAVSLFLFRPLLFILFFLGFLVFGILAVVAGAIWVVLRLL